LQLNHRSNILIVPCTEWLKGSQQRLHHLSKEWSKKNNVYVFYLERQDNILTNGIFSERLQYGSILKIPTVKIRNYTLFLLANFIFQIIYLPAIVKKNQIQVIVAEGLGTSNAASFISTIMRRRFIFDYSDSYSAFVSSYISSHFARKILESLATLLTNINIGLSSATVVVSDGLLTDRFDSCKQYKIVNGVSEDYFPINKSSSKFNDDKILITFVGAVESWVNFESLLDAIKELNKKDNKFLLRIVGDGLKLKEVKDMCIGKGLTQSVAFTGWVPYAELHRYLADSNFCVLPFDDSLISSHSMPMKIHEYAISKKPIISTPLPEICKIYGSTVMYASTKEEYVHAIELLLNDKDLTSKQAEAAYKIAKNYSWTELSKRYEQLFNKESSK
jgi:glycosyltransferase involved in cell wall biosynthesis